MIIHNIANWILHPRTLLPISVCVDVLNPLEVQLQAARILPGEKVLHKQLRASQGLEVLEVRFQRGQGLELINDNRDSSNCTE